jgi:hypothetical protein
VMSRMASVITHNFYFFENRCYCNILVQLVWNIFGFMFSFALIISVPYITWTSVFHGY